jgi:predicted membrane chloride channel (bestrophin family)
VWLYLFFLPFQLVGQFQWYTVPGVFVAAFTYLGFLAAGEEIEQPFGTALIIDMPVNPIDGDGFYRLRRCEITII